MKNINGKTSLLGLIGDPVSHSLSPIMHNTALAEMGLNWCYVPLQCSNANLKSILESLRNLDFKGLNVTIPHKKNVTKLCAALSPLAEKLQAVNTLSQNNISGWTGENTDLLGFLAPLKDSQWNNKNALVIGCGGSAKAVVTGLTELQFNEITIIGRKKESLKKFLNDMSINENDFNSTQIKILLQDDTQVIAKVSNADLIINCTPLGMKETAQEIIPLGREIWDNLKKETILYDLIYTPRPTAWLKIGNKKGLKTIDGLEMLVQQGAASLKIWSGFSDIPIQSMRKAAEKHLYI